MPVPAAAVEAVRAQAAALVALRPYRAQAAAALVPWSAPWVAPDGSGLARAAQLPPPGAWRYWCLQAGRGFGKTRAAAEYICEEVAAGRAAQVMLIAATASDVRDVVVEGPSGILAVAERRGVRVRYEPSKQRLTWPQGQVARTRSADEPDRIRGPEADLAWWDEFGTWAKSEAFTNADLGLRRPGPDGSRARAVIAFTPKPTALVKELLGRPDAAITRGRTEDNAANLDPATLAAYRAAYAGSRLGRQELEGELLEEVEGALWTLAGIDAARLVALPEGVALARVVVGVDPPASAAGAECGIVVAALGSDGRGYVLADYSRRGSPNEWAGSAVQAYDDFAADAVVIETNQGGEMATGTLKTVRPDLPVSPVHAARGKATRAEPIAALYEQGRVSHLGCFPALEDQMAGWVPGEASPDRMDALVWSFTALMLAPAAPDRRVRVWRR